MHWHGTPSGPDVTVQHLLDSLRDNYKKLFKSQSTQWWRPDSHSAPWTACIEAAMNAAKHIVAVKWHNFHFNFIWLHMPETWWSC